MIIRALPYFLATFILAVAIMPAKAAVEIGKPAPAIETTDIHGHSFNLADHKGKIVVLEWTNKDCPYVVKHYATGNMQKLQQELRDQGGVWVSIISSAEGEQGYLTIEQAKEQLKSVNSNVTTQILDPSGVIGKAYDAKVSPHMFVIDADGNVAYAGAIDSDSSARHESVETADNYVKAAIDALNKGEDVKVTTSAPYGCGIKYATE